MVGFFYFLLLGIGCDDQFCQSSLWLSNYLTKHKYCTYAKSNGTFFFPQIYRIQRLRRRQKKTLPTSALTRLVSLHEYNWIVIHNQLKTSFFASSNNCFVFFVGSLEEKVLNVTQFIIEYVREKESNFRNNKSQKRNEQILIVIQMNMWQRNEIKYRIFIDFSIVLWEFAFTFFDLFEMIQIDLLKIYFSFLLLSLWLFFSSSSEVNVQTNNVNSNHVHS